MSFRVLIPFALVLVLCAAVPVCAADGGSTGESVALAEALLEKAEQAKFQKTKARAVAAANRMLTSSNDPQLGRAFGILEKELTERPRISPGMLGLLRALSQLPNVNLYNPDVSLIHEKARLAMQVYGLAESAYLPAEGDPEEYQSGTVMVTIGQVRETALGVILDQGNHDFLNVPAVRAFFLAHLDHPEESDPHFGADMLRQFVAGGLYTLGASWAIGENEPQPAEIFTRLVQLLEKRLNAPPGGDLYRILVVHDLIEGLTEHVAEHADRLDVEAFLKVLEVVIKAKGNVPVTSNVPHLQPRLFAAAALAKERLVTDWSGGRARN